MNISYYYNRLIENAINKGNAKKSGTFRGWQDKVIAVREALKSAEADYKKELSELSETYSTKVFDQKRTEIDNRYQAIVRDATSKLVEQLDEVIASKKKQYDASSGAPTAEDIRLLQALGMRTKLSVAEVSTAVEKLNSNVQSLAVLKDIAVKHGINVPITTPEDFDMQLQRAREFSIDRLRDIDVVDDKQLQYQARCFFFYPDDERSPSHDFYFKLDNNVLTTEQISKSAKTGQQQATANEPIHSSEADKTNDGNTADIVSEVTVTGVMNINTLASQFHTSVSEIKECNPGKDLSRLYTGDKILIPSTKFSFMPGSSYYAQPEMVRPVPRPVYEDATGPSGEKVGDDVSII